LRDGCPRRLLDPIEIASRDEIIALQTRRLKATLRLAHAKVPHYRAKFAAAEVHPDDFRRLEDIAKFPFTTKDDLRRTYPFGMFAVPRKDVLRVHASSGTTGKPTVVGYTAADLANWAELGARSIRAAGGLPGDIVHVAYGYGLFTGGLGAHAGAERLGCTVIPMSGGQTEKQVQLIVDFKPDIIMVTPSYMLAIADEFARQGLDPRGTALKIGIHGAEPWTDAMRREIEERFAIDAVDIYGLSEVMGPGVANECVETKDGPVIWEDHFLPEIVDPVTGAPLGDGERGELVFTALTKQALPIIRYRTRDLTRLLPGTARSHRRMDRITGRSDDNVFPTQIEELILRDDRLSPHYVIEVKREDRLDTIDIVVECKPEHEDGASAHDAAARLTQLVKSHIGVSADVRVEKPGTIQRSIGKAKRVIDLRPKESA
jgi:phenylacetate-CoA ligase